MKAIDRKTSIGTALLGIFVLLALLLVTGVSWAQEPVPFECTGEAYTVRDASAQLYRIDQSVTPFVFIPVGGPQGIQLNNLGYRITDNLLYAVAMPENGDEENFGIVKIDSTGGICEVS